MILNELLYCVIIIVILSLLIVPNILDYVDITKNNVDITNTKIIENIIIEKALLGENIKDKDYIENVLIKKLGEIPKILSKGYFQYNYNTGRVSISKDNIPDENCFILGEKEMEPNITTNTFQITPKPKKTKKPEKTNNGNHYGQI